MIDLLNKHLSLTRQCQLLGLTRSSLYYQPATDDTEDLVLMARIDRQFLETPYYGSRKMTAWLRREGHAVNRKRVRRLMRQMGLQVIWQKPNTSKPNPEPKVYPYLLRGLTIDRPNQVWATGPLGNAKRYITYIPMPKGFFYLAAVIDWFPRMRCPDTVRHVPNWRRCQLRSVKIFSPSARVCPPFGRSPP